MNTHNICFRREIRKITAFFKRKKRFICCYGYSMIVSLTGFFPLELTNGDIIRLLCIIWLSD